MTPRPSFSAKEGSMNANRLAWTFLIIPIFTLYASTAEPLFTQSQAVQVLPEIQPGGKDQPKVGDKGKDKDKDKKPADKKSPSPQEVDPFTQTPAPVSNALGFNPHMIGDF